MILDKNLVHFKDKNGCFQPKFHIRHAWVILLYKMFQVTSPQVRMSEMLLKTRYLISQSFKCDDLFSI